ncbi:hypothetical protein B296_00048898 [Ensete ventricosum]|uniref:Uncharacterized protein n=1 Tax=Ensete ventricosum TaxID=4639 RepID=A0A426YSW8_ENSVE|nr:hypothetical protein B296_00048898 [Ensete ventricosum]
MEPTSFQHLVGAGVPRELLPISSAGPLSRSFDPVIPSSGSERVPEPLKEATYEQPISSPSILVAMLLGAEALCAEPSAEDGPSSPQPLAGAGPSGDSLDLAQGPCAMAVPHEGAVVSSKGLTTAPSNNLSVGSAAPSPRPFAPPTTFEQPAASSRVPSAQQLWEEAKAATGYYRGLLNSALVELVHRCPSEVLANLCSCHEVLLHELDLEFNLALRRAEEAEARTEEAYDEATIIEDMVALSVTECERKVETLSCELKDAR